MTNELVALKRARADIERLENIGGAMHAASKMDVLQHALKKAGHSQRLQNEAAALKLRAERRAGELIDELVPEQGGNPAGGASTFATLGLDRNHGLRLRKLARVPIDMFEQYLAEAYARDDEITRAGALRLHPVTPRTTVSTFEFVAPSVPEEIAQRIAGDQGEELAELIAASIEGALHHMVESGQARHAFIWSRRHGITHDGEVGESWTFAGIAQMVPNEKGEPSSREYIENQYYRAHSSVMAQLASDALHHLKLAVQGQI